MEPSYKSAFDAIADTPQQALNMKLRADLINQIIKQIESNHWTQKEAAKQLGVTQPRVSDLLRGKMSLFSLDTLVNMLATMGKDIEIHIKAA